MSRPRPSCCKFVSKGEFSFGELQLYKRANWTAGIRIYNEPIKFLLNKTINAVTLLALSTFLLRSHCNFYKLAF